MRNSLLRRISQKDLSILQSSTSKWTWEVAKHVGTLVHVRHLGLPLQPMSLMQEALCQLRIDKASLLLDGDPSAHVDIAETMAKLGIKDMNWEDVIKLPKDQGQAYLQRLEERKNMFLNLQRFMVKIRRALRAEECLLADKQRAMAEKSAVNSDREKVIDTLAWTVATICGFDEYPLVLTATGLDDLITGQRAHEFKMFKQTVTSKPDLFVVRSANETAFPDKMVIIFEDKCESTVPHGGHLGQILGECLMMQYNNLIRHNFASSGTSSVYCMRLINHYIQFFALECTKTELTQICDTNPPTTELITKLRLICHQADAETSSGLDLLDTTQRREAMVIASSLRQAVC